MALGFIQSLVALDAADSSLDSFWTIINLLIQALLGSPDFDTTAEGFGHPFGLIIYYVSHLTFPLAEWLDGSSGLLTLRLDSAFSPRAGLS
jgi:hypothetical protein